MDKCITREAAHEMVRNLPRYVNKESRYTYGVNEMVDYDVVQHGLDNLPAADVRENVRGKWVWDRNYSFHNDKWVCGNCGKSPPTVCLTDPKIHPLEHEGYDYCGFCGADMRPRDKDV